MDKVSHTDLTVYKGKNLLCLFKTAQCAAVWQTKLHLERFILEHYFHY